MYLKTCMSFVKAKEKTCLDETYKYVDIRNMGLYLASDCAVTYGMKIK